uniref:Uncharacterized protein n=1 Tax=Arion vulgaris TaxID=1028688 RepID=A0A0B7AKR3_9EUPU
MRVLSLPADVQDMHADDSCGMLLHRYSALLVQHCIPNSINHSILPSTVRFLSNRWSLGDCRKYQVSIIHHQQSDYMYFCCKSLMQD